MDEEPKPRKFDRIRTHLENNKKVYLVGAGCLTAGYFLRPQVVSVVDSFNIKYKSPVTNNVITVLERRGHPGYKYLNSETGEAAASMKRMAEIDGVSRTFVRNHTGDDDIYKNLGEMK